MDEQRNKKQQLVVAFRLLGEFAPLAANLQERVGTGVTGSIHDVARRDLERYYEMLRRNLPTFSMEEALLLVDVENGHIVMPEMVSMLWAEVQDALDEGYAEKWHVDGPTLVKRLRALTPFQCMAIADAIERVWHISSTSSDDNMEAIVRAVGMVKG